MTKREIYEHVVQLTSGIAQTKIAQKIFDFASQGDSIMTQMIIDCFPVYYPELYQKIEKFGEEFNKIVGESEEDKGKFARILQKCEALMYDLADTKVIDKITKATETGDPEKLQEVIDIFKNENSYLVEKLMNFQEEYTNFRNTASKGLEGSIFGIEADEEKGIFVFDTNIIDALSFYLLTILGNIDDIYFFCEIENSEDPFLDAIENATNEALAEFVANYSLFNKPYETIGELLVAALADEFEEDEEE